MKVPGPVILEPGHSLAEDGLPRYRPVQFLRAGVVSGNDIQNFGAPAGTNTKNTTYTQLLSAVANTMDADGFYLRYLVGNAVADYLVDLAVGPGSSEVNIIDNILFSGCNGFTSSGHVYVPLRIAAGQRISIRCQSTDGSATLNVGLTLVKGGPYAAMSCRRATTYGAATGDSGGVSIDAGGSAGTPGSWAQITASTTNPIKYALVCVGGQNNATRTDGTHIVEIGTGASLSEVAVGDFFYVRQVGGPFDGVLPALHGTWLDPPIPAGTRLAGRHASSVTDATDRLIDISVIGFD